MNITADAYRNVYLHIFYADSEFNEAFLLTFYSFMSPDELLNSLEERLGMIIMCPLIVCSTSPPPRLSE